VNKTTLQVLTLRALSWKLGFLLPMRRLRDRIAAFESTDFDLIRSDISRFAAISSLFAVSILHTYNARARKAHSELEVALSICSSSWVEDVNQPAIMVRHALPR
jgi:hypothetical protein